MNTSNYQEKMKLKLKESWTASVNVNNHHNKSKIKFLFLTLRFFGYINIYIPSSDIPIFVWVTANENVKFFSASISRADSYIRLHILFCFIVRDSLFGQIIPVRRQISFFVCLASHLMLLLYDIFVCAFFRLWSDTIVFGFYFISVLHFRL